MSRIKILPEILSNKIAAGEVVERPASVVKELVENAVDAESDRIVIEIEKGGRNLIRVSDNGLGMNHDEALLALERYATSKIYADEDLYAIRTLGFRGEALPSIASVSRFEMISRDRESETGTRIEVSGGKIVNVSAVGAPVGTMIAVRQLFFNTPARRKFLKAETTEMGHIADTLSAIALAWPSVQFRLVHDGRPLKTWNQAKDARDRVLDVLGADLKGRLNQLEPGPGPVNVRGWAASPDVTRSTSQKIFLFVNGRYVRDRGVLQAVFEGYRERLMKGRFPVGVLFIEVPFDQVDVNVHPTKHEVRFADYRSVYDAVRAAVVGAFERVRAQSSARENRGETPVARPAEERPMPREQALFTGERTPTFFKNALPPVKRTDASHPGVAEAAKSFSSSPSPAEVIPAATEKQHGTHAYEADQPAAAQGLLREESRFADLEIIGQFRTTYILCESREGLVLIDQHAAHERILYEQIKQRMADGRQASQRLLMPETFELGHRETDILHRLCPEFAALGLDIEPFGGNTFVIKAVPLPLADGNVAPIVVEMVEKIVDTGFAPGLEKILDACMMIMACHGAIRANQRLNREEMTALLKQLDGCANPRHCPHGRPTSIRWSLSSLEKAFKRIV